MAQVTQLLVRIEQGDPIAADQLLPLVYSELRKLAAAKMAREQPGHTLQPTVLVHEAYVRLVDVDQPQEWDGRAHFFAAAAEAMRRVLVEYARRKQSQKRGGDLRRVELDVDRVTNQTPDEDLLALNEALNLLEQQMPDRAKLVKLRYFAGLTIPEAAEVLGVSTATAERYWRFARAWLHSQLKSRD
jgi:RNA polymerase sigma factor (TIGR02999 family)